VIEAYGSVVIEGFRQSLDQVAAFRFTDIGNSYSARRGSGQHVGVIGVAVFKEYQPRRPRSRADADRHAAVLRALRRRRVRLPR
jgi:hypothetical protein